MKGKNISDQHCGGLYDTRLCGSNAV